MSERGEKTYRPWEPERYRQDAQSPAAKLPEGDLVFFLLDTVPQLELRRFYAPYEHDTRGAVRSKNSDLAFWRGLRASPHPQLAYGALHPVVYPNSADHSIAPKTGYNALISAPVGGGNAMVAPHGVSPLVLCARIWLFLLLPLTRPKCPGLAPATPTAEPEPLTPKRHRANVPHPCEGLTHQPHCA